MDWVQNFVSRMVGWTLRSYVLRKGWVGPKEYNKLTIYKNCLVHGWFCHREWGWVWNLRFLNWNSTIGRIGRCFTIHQTEIRLCKTVAYKTIQGQIYLCNVDSRAALKVHDTCYFTSSLNRKCFELLFALARFNSVLSRWIPGHIGLKWCAEAECSC